MSHLTPNLTARKAPFLDDETKEELRALRDAREAAESRGRCQERLDFKLDNVAHFGKEHYNFFKRDGFYYIVTFPVYHFSTTGTTLHHCRYDERKLRPDQIAKLEEFMKK